MKKTIGASAVILLLGGGAAFYVDQTRNQRLLETQRDEALADAKEERARRKAMQAILARMTEERVVADVVVLSQEKDEQGKLWTEIRLHMKSSAENPLKPKTYKYKVQGDRIYFEAYTLRFEDKYLKMGTTAKGRALNLLTRVFGEKQAPADGFAVEDPSKTIPHYYSLGNPELESFERELWAKFWWYTTHRADAKKDGVEVAHGQAPFTKFDVSLIYELVADARGNLTVRQKL